MPNLIDLIPEELLDDIRKGECLPVVGAGLSLNAIIPPKCKMPLWNDLGEIVAKKMGKTCNGNPMASLSEYCQTRTKFQLVTLLRDCLHVETARPGKVHTEFARLPFRQVLTTNFDFLLEQAYLLVGKSCLPVVDAELLSFRSTDRTTRILKMHGDLHHPTVLVVTESDYDKFRDNKDLMFAEVTNLLFHHSVLFVGYSVEDPDFRQIWQLVDKYLKPLRRPAYALLVGASTEQIDTYRRRGVTSVISLPGTSSIYGKVLTQAFIQIGKAL